MKREEVVEVESGRIKQGGGVVVEVVDGRGVERRRTRKGGHVEYSVMSLRGGVREGKGGGVMECQYEVVRARE